ncbi:unnamed protein product, partial [Closterium sp. NIES-53]
GPAPSGVSQVDPLLGTVPVEVTVDSGAARGATSGGAEPTHAEPGGANSAGAKPGGAESEDAGSGGAEPGGAELGGVLLLLEVLRVPRTGRRVPRPRPPPVPGTHHMALRPSSVPQRVPLLSTPSSDLVRAANPTAPRLLATVVTDPWFESAAASAPVAKLVGIAATLHLEYAASSVAESESTSDCPLSVGGECALGMDVLEDRQQDYECFRAALPHLVSMLIALEGDPDAPDIPTLRSYEEAIEGPYSSQWETAMDAEMAS